MCKVRKHSCVTSDPRKHQDIYVNGIPIDDHLDRINQRPDQPLEPSTPHKECPRGKKRYPNRQRAEDALRHVIERNTTERSYLPRKVWGPCRSCDGWHLTANTGKTWKSGKKRR